MLNSVKTHKMTIVSFTSWPKRIQYAGITIFSMLRQTHVPDLILLQLSKQEFPNLWKDLPIDLQYVCACNHPRVQIRWHDNNTRAFKKVIPAIKEFRNTDAWILSVDDDIIYDSTYIEYMVNEANMNPDVCCTPGFSKLGNGLFVHGCGMIYNTKWFKNNTLFSFNIDDVNNIIASDHWITAALYTNGIQFRKLKNFLEHVTFLELENPLGNIYSTQAPFAKRTKYIINKFNEMNYNIKPLFDDIGVKYNDN